MSTQSTDISPPEAPATNGVTSPAWGKQPTCGNCNYSFTNADNFCPECGQPNRTHKRPLRYFIREFFEELLSLDARAFATLRDLVLKPGRLTQRYNNNHRVAYTAPIRFYVLTSVFFFITVSWITQSSIRRADSQLSEVMAEPDSLFNDMNLKIFRLHLGPEDFDALQSLDVFTMEGVDSVLTAQGKESTWLDKRVVLGLEPLLKGRFSLEQYYNRLLKNFSYSLFFFMPLMALLLKLAYIRRHQFYTEHLIFAIHFHTFVFLLLFVSLLIDHFRDAFGITPLSIVGTMIYMAISMKVVYEQGWIKTLLKGTFVFWAYIFAVFTGFSFLLLLSLF